MPLVFATVDGTAFHFRGPRPRGCSNEGKSSCSGASVRAIRAAAYPDEIHRAPPAVAVGKAQFSAVVLPFAAVLQLREMSTLYRRQDSRR